MERSYREGTNARKLGSLLTDVINNHRKVANKIADDMASNVYNLRRPSNGVHPDAKPS